MRLIFPKVNVFFTQKTTKTYTFCDTKPIWEYLPIPIKLIHFLKSSGGIHFDLNLLNWKKKTQNEKYNKHLHIIQPILNHEEVPTFLTHQMNSYKHYKVCKNDCLTCLMEPSFLYFLFIFWWKDSTKKNTRKLYIPEYVSLRLCIFNVHLIRYLDSGKRFIVFLTDESWF
jgi:hypothetical protein